MFLVRRAVFSEATPSISLNITRKAAARPLPFFYVTLLTLIFHPSKENIQASYFPRREVLLQAGKWHSKR